MNLRHHKRQASAAMARRRAAAHAEWMIPHRKVWESAMRDLSERYREFLALCDAIAPLDNIFAASSL